VGKEQEREAPGGGPLFKASVNSKLIGVGKKEREGAEGLKPQSAEIMPSFTPCKGKGIRRSRRNLP